MNRLCSAFALAGVLGLAACSLTEPADQPLDVSANSAMAYPDQITLATRPEGIAIGNGNTFYAGTVGGPANELGTIWRGDLRTGEVSVLYPADNVQVLGLKYDARSRYLFAARGGTGGIGRGTVIDDLTGAVVQEFSFATAPTFINDVIVTRQAAYFTDSQRAQLYRVPLGSAGQLAGGFTTIPLGGDWIQTITTHCSATNPNPYNMSPGFNANGIVATPDGNLLLVNNLRVGKVYRVDPATGDATEVNLGGGNVCYADGMLLVGHTLYVVQNFLARVAVIQLSPDYASGVIARYIQHTHPITTLARHGSALYAVTAGFFTGNPWEVVRLGR